MKAALCSTVDRIEIKEMALPEIGDGEILLKVDLCGVCGSDIKKLQGEGLNRPLVLGHEVVGQIERLGAGVSQFKEGQRVVVAHHVPCFSCTYCRHGNYSMCRAFKESNLDPGGFAQYLRIPATHVKTTTFLVPDDLPSEKALFMEPLACCLRCLKRLALQPGDSVLIIGFGSIGMLLLSLLERIPVKILAFDLADERLARAKQLGARAISPRDDLRRVIADETGGFGVDAVIFTAGTPETLRDSFNWVRDGGTLCLFAELSGDQTVALDHQAIYKRELTILSSYSPGPQDLQDSFQLIASNKVNLDPQEVLCFSLPEIPRAIHSILERRILKAAITPHEK